jgi:hypothetical protein
MKLKGTPYDKLTLPQLLYLVGTGRIDFKSASAKRRG